MTLVGFICLSHLSLALRNLFYIKPEWEDTLCTQNYPGVVTHQEDPFLASTMRMGWEWLLTPLLLYQNYHLIHHLYPTVPFYKIHDAWYLKYDELNTGNISYRGAFGLTPENIALHSPKL